MDFDFAGTIVALGSDAVAGGHLAVGDRVAGVVYGMDRLHVGTRDCNDGLWRIPRVAKSSLGVSMRVRPRLKTAHLGRAPSQMCICCLIRVG